MYKTELCTLCDLNVNGDEYHYNYNDMSIFQTEYGTLFKTLFLY